LYYRLNTFQIEVPSLRESKRGIPPLIAQFVRQFFNNSANPSRSFHRMLSRSCSIYSWPGNVRELQNAIEYAVVLARAGVIGVKGTARRNTVASALQQAELTALPRKGVQTLDDLERERNFKLWPNVAGTRKKQPNCSGFSDQPSTTN
jgi:DNA-binding NtrC family response regulator